MKFNKRMIFNILITLVVAFIYFYIFLPPINIHAMEFWVFIILMYLLSDTTLYNRSRVFLIDQEARCRINDIFFLLYGAL